MQETIQHLAALGCARAIVVPAVFAVDSLATLLDMNHAARQAESASSISAVVLPPWRDDAHAVGALAVSVRSSLAEATSLAPQQA